MLFRNEVKPITYYNFKQKSIQFPSTLSKLQCSKSYDFETYKNDINKKFVCLINPQKQKKFLYISDRNSLRGSLENTFNGNK